MGKYLPTERCNRWLRIKNRKASWVITGDDKIDHLIRETNQSILYLIGGCTDYRHDKPIVYKEEKNLYAVKKLYKDINSMAYKLKVWGEKDHASDIKREAKDIMMTFGILYNKNKEGNNDKTH